jgi:hypothetical protein
MFAQKPVPIIEKVFILTNDTLKIDTLILINGSVKIAGYIAKKDYDIDYYQGLLINKTIAPNTLLNIQYQAVNLGLNKRYSYKDRSIILPELNAQKNPFAYVPSGNNFEPIGANEGLLVNGSIMRGLSIGNNQNAIVNSNLNLQLSGKINNDVDVLAAISDDNNPIQPEGNTQEIQDFDQVFVQFGKGLSKVIVGDYLMSRPQNSYFMNYYKKSRGLQFVTGTPLKNNKGLLSFGAEAALSRGKFVRNLIPGIEGNQGPYRLTGPNGELFIIIVSGTEAVYLDGERLTRGEQNDYIIDYNTGEFTFMAKRLITQYSRIVVEFQYADRNYARTVVGGHALWQQRNTQAYLNYFNEGDNKNQPFQQVLTDSNKIVLASAGDDASKAAVLNEVPVSPFDNKRILYRKIDTLGFEKVYVYAPTATSDTIYYEVRFTYVGSNKGNYVQSASAANGRVFSWVTPKGGQLQGDFEALTFLIAPTRKQMLNTGVVHQINSNHLLKAEISVSANNQNLFSELDKQDNVGYAVKLESNNRFKLKDTTKSFESTIFYEGIDANFRYVERYRAVEFDRIWNRQLQNSTELDTGNKEHILNWRLGFKQLNKIDAYYQFGFYNKGEGAFIGNRHLGGLVLRDAKNFLDAKAEVIGGEQISLVNNPAYTNQIQLLQGKYTRSFRKQLVSVLGIVEQSKFSNAGDSLLQNSYAYKQWGLNFRPADTLRYSYYADYYWRQDFLPVLQNFRQHTVANDYKAGLTLMQKNTNRLSADFSFRNFRLKDTSLSNLTPELTFLSRISYDYAFWKRRITANSYIQVGSGNELRRDYQFIEVPTGQGVYVWKDFNEDGIQQLNEFLIASFADKNLANFIKVFLPSTSLISTYSSQFSQTLNINPAPPLRNERGAKAFLKRFSNQSGVRYEKKTGVDESFNLRRFIEFNVQDTMLIALNSLLRNTLFFNRSHPIWGMDLNWNRNVSKNLLTNGFELRIRQETGLNFRYNFNQNWTYTQAILHGNRSLNSDFFSENNFDYQYIEVKPKLSYQHAQNWRLSANYMFSESENKPSFGSEMATVNQLGFEFRYTLTKLGVATINYNIYDVSYAGNANTALAYDMLQGLSVGKNQIVSFTLQQRIGQNLQINFNYDGRKSGSLPIIHTGRMEARYLF